MQSKYDKNRVIFFTWQTDEMAFSKVISSDMQLCLFADNLSPLFKRNENISLVIIFNTPKYSRIFGVFRRTESQTILRIKISWRFLTPHSHVCLAFSPLLAWTTCKGQRAGCVSASMSFSDATNFRHFTNILFWKDWLQKKKKGNLQVPTQFNKVSSLKPVSTHYPT